MDDSHERVVLPIKRDTWQWIGVGVALFLVGGIALAVWWSHEWSNVMHDMFTGKTGPVSSRVDWPRPLKELLNESGEIEIDESTIQVHCLCGGAFDSEFVWRMDAAPGLFELLEERWKLAPLSASEWGVWEGFKGAMTSERAPAWWVPIDDGQTSFYVSPRGFDGDGDRFRVAVDDNRSTVWVHFLYTF